MFYGAQYYRPPFPYKEDWQRDFENMENLGFNCVKLWAVWNWIEKEQGQFDFSDLDELVILAKKHNLGVIINTIPEGAPYWTYDGDNTRLYHTADGQKVHYGGPANLPTAGWPGLCIDDSDFAMWVSRFIEKTAEHFSNEESVIAIDVWNEPHLEPMYDYRQNMLCYCENSQKKFRNWLKEKYQTLENINKAWYRTYTDWAQVTPPPRFGTWADMLDWRRFWLENMRDWLRLRVNASRKGASNIPVQTHVAYSGILGNKINGGLANELGDEFLLAKEVDIFGLSSFPKWLMGPKHRYRHFLHSEMIHAASGSKIFYQVELQGGAGKPGLLGSEVPTTDDINVWNWNTVAVGGKGSVYWQYAPEPAGIESPGFGLTGLKGENLDRSMAASKCAKELNTKLMDNAVGMDILNAVYVSRDSDLLCFAAERKEDMYAGSLSGICLAAYKEGIPFSFFHQDNIECLSKSNIKTLYLPMGLILCEKEVDCFVQFVQNGGTLISEACPGLYKQDGLLEQNSKALRTLFGLDHIDIEAASEWGEISAKMCGNEDVFTGRFYRQLVSVGKDTEVLARFENGYPALTQRICGDGKAIWIGTFPSYHYEHSCDDSTRKLLTRWFKKGGYSAVESISYTPNIVSDVPAAPIVRLHESEGTNVLIAVNHCDYSVDVRVEFKNEQRFEDGICSTVLEFSLEKGGAKLYQW